MLKSLIKISNQQVLLPFYHLVTDKTPNFIKHLYKPKGIAKFTADLDAFLKHYNPISLAELLAIKTEKKQLTQVSFHLTFDDGLANFYDVIAPILIKKKIPATVFLNTDFVDNKDLFYRYKASLLIDNYLNASENVKDIYVNFVKKEIKKKYKEKERRAKSENYLQLIKSFLLGITFKNKKLLDKLAKKLNYSFEDFLEKEKPYLTIKQIKELQKQGFTFGAHSCNHPNYSELELKEQLNQTQKSVQWLQENLNIQYKVFSFPFSDIGVSKDFFRLVNLDISFGTSGIKKDIISTNLQRIDMEKINTKSKHFLIKEYVKYMLKIPFGKHILKRN